LTEIKTITLKRKKICNYNYNSELTTEITLTTALLTMRRGVDKSSIFHLPSCRSVARYVMFREH